MINLSDLITKHTNYQRLVSLLNNISQQPDSTSIGQLELSNVPFSLQNILLRSLSDDGNTSIFASLRDSMETRKYLQSVEFIDLIEIKPSTLIRYLNNYNFKKSIKLSELGEFSVTGDVISFWPIGMEHPLRASFFDDRLEFCNSYDEIYGKKFASHTKFFIGDLSKFESNFAKTQFISIIKEDSLRSFVIIFGGDNLDTFNSKNNLNFDYIYPQLYFNRLDILKLDLEPLLSQKYKFFIQTTHKDILPEELKKYINEFSEELESGLISKDLKTIILTDREIFGTIFLNKATKRLTSDRARKLLSELEGEIAIDDFIVHEDHGIGVYKGLTQETYEQKVPLDFGKFKTNIIKEDYILIQYAQGDELYVPLAQIDKITKYIGNEENPPEVTRLGKNEWVVLKQKVKKDIAIIAKELVSLYAKRALVKAPVMLVEDDKEYEDFLNDFTYTPTRDQIRTEKEILFDLGQDIPMNRLIVGDVGFGKTEVAMRASFKVCQAGYQVVVLCPTTVLTAQHEKVFSDRFKNTPFKVVAISRMNKSELNKNTDLINSNKVQIIIGTHRLLSSDLKFPKLGMLIIDEEQKFGVKQKEKLKQLHENVHVLTMSATPIPRSLSMALSAIQEISLIQTPPENRKSIITYVHKMDWQKVVEAIHFEVSRSGQIYFLHNDVKTINSTFEKLKALMPHVKFNYAHGQMNTQLLGKTVRDFYNHEFDCLICTTIIENGIDMPNVNTIIVEKAQNFGLGQLYQLRGRVGRAERQAYAYFFYEGKSIDKKPGNDDESLIVDGKGLKLKQKKYIKRLKAILENNEIGSGFKIASNDLEIRGAGNLLGKQQHGNIKFMGYGLYMQLLSEEIEKMKNILELNNENNS